MCGYALLRLHRLRRRAGRDASLPVHGGDHARAEEELAQGETAEIRCELVREGEFDGAVYTIRYFQYDGEGTLKLDNGLVFLPNDRYLLENEKFRLYYTSECDESQSLTITVEDNFGNAFEWEVEFMQRCRTP